MQSSDLSDKHRLQFMLVRATGQSQQHRLQGSAALHFQDVIARREARFAQLPTVSALRFPAGDPRYLGLSDASPPSQDFQPFDARPSVHYWPSLTSQINHVTSIPQVADGCRPGHRGGGAIMAQRTLCHRGIFHPRRERQSRHVRGCECMLMCSFNRRCETPMMLLIGVDD